MDFPFTSATAETLPNGLVLILDPDPTAPVVSCQIWVETGSLHEDKLSGAGLSHFLEHLVFKGTRDYDAEHLASAVQAAGGHWNAYTTFDRTVYYIDGPSTSLGEFLKCLTGLVYFPTLPETAFELEKEVIRREIDMGLDDPDHASTRLLLHTAFRNDPRRQPVIGQRHLFDSITYQDILSYHKSRYTTDHSFIVISGDFDPAAARAAVLALTEDCRPGAGAEIHVPVDHPQLGPREARETFAIPVSRICLAWKSPALDQPEAAAFDVLASILGRGKSSILYRHLREEQGLALEIAAWHWTTPGREGIFAISADADPSQRDGLIDAIWSEIDALAPVLTLADLAKAKRQILTSQFRALTTASGRASDLGSNWHEARDLNFTRHHVCAINAVSLAEVHEALTALSRQRSILTILDPEGSAPRSQTRGKPAVSLRHETFELTNGLQVALVPDRRVPLVYLQAAVLAGLPSETTGTNGINQLLAATLSTGAAGKSSAEISLALESLGASLGASAGNNALLVNASGLGADFLPIVKLFADVVMKPDFPADALLREKASQQAAMEEALQEPLHQAFRTLRSALFSGSGYGLDALGSTESLYSLGPADLAAHHRHQFQAANTVIAVAGDFDTAAVRDTLEEHFAQLPAGTRWTPPPSRISSHAENPIVRLPKKQAVLAIGFPGAAVADPDRHALAFLQEYVSDMAGPLFTRLREELGLAYQVGATQFLGADTGMFAFYIATSPERVDEARSEMLAEIRKIAATGIPASILEQVRATVLSGHAIQRQSPAAVARQISLDLLFGQPADSYHKLPEIYHALDASRIQSAAERFFSSSPVIATVLPDTR